MDKTCLPDVPLLTQAYDLKEQFLQILDLKSQAGAEAAFWDWRQKVETWLNGDELVHLDEGHRKAINAAFHSFINLVAENLSETFSGLADGLSNARTENANGRIRVIEGVGQGFSYGVLKDRILYGHLTPSRDLYECDICGKRSVERSAETNDTGGSWNAEDCTLHMRQQFCDGCWDRFTSTRLHLGEQPTPIDEEFPVPRAKPAIRERSRAHQRAKAKPSPRRRSGSRRGKQPDSTDRQEIQINEALRRPVAQGQDTNGQQRSTPKARVVPEARDPQGTLF